MRLAGEAFLPEEDVLVLQAGVVGVEVACAAAGGCGVALEVEEFREAALHRLAEGNLREVCVRELVFGVDPRLELGGVDVFHPAIGVADLGAEVVVDLVDFSRCGIGEGCVDFCSRWGHEVRFPDFFDVGFAALAARSFLRSVMRRFRWVGGLARASLVCLGSLSWTTAWAARRRSSRSGLRRTFQCWRATQWARAR